jgi:hypothetical protein
VINLETLFDTTNNSFINTIIMNEIKNQLIHSQYEEDDDDDSSAIFFAPVQIIYQAESDDE